MPDILEEPPPLVDPPGIEGVEFDVAALDPANMFAALKAAAPDPDPAPDPTKTPDPTPDPARVAPDPAPPKPEPKNFKELKALRAQAEAERDTFKAQAEALAAKVADLEPRATTYEKEREGLESRIKEHEAAIAERDATLRRTAARETPQWTEKANAIRAAAKNVEDIVGMPELKEAGITHSMETLLNPGAKAALNDTLRVLNDAGKYAEAQDLMDAHRSVQAWRADLRKIEADTAEEAKAWSANREAAIGNVFRSVRDTLAQANPIHSARSPEYLALPKEQQEFLTTQYRLAEGAAQKTLEIAGKPEELAAHAYRTALAGLLMHESGKGMQARVAAQETELVSLRQKVADYEKAAGGGAPVGGSRGVGQNEPTSAEEEAKFLDPANFPGFGGVRK